MGSPPALDFAAWSEGTAELRCAGPAGSSASRTGGLSLLLGRAAGCSGARPDAAVSCGSVGAAPVSPALLAAVATAAAGAGLTSGDSPTGRDLAAELAAAPSVESLRGGAAVTDASSRHAFRDAGITPGAAVEAEGAGAAVEGAACSSAARGALGPSTREGPLHSLPGGVSSTASAAPSTVAPPAAPGPLTAGPGRWAPADSPPAEVCQSAALMRAAAFTYTCIHRSSAGTGAHARPPQAVAAYKLCYLEIRVSR